MEISDKKITFTELKTEVLADYKLCLMSRKASLLGRKEVLTGKAKFGIFGGGKELAQIAMAKQFKNGDFRSGYYRDQTFMMAIGELTVQQLFAAIYAHTDLEHEPTSGGRQMGGHYATRSLNEDGSWKNLMGQKNSSADVSPTASQMPRLLGLAQASKVYRNNPDLSSYSQFSEGGNEVAFGTIGDSSTSEGLFWETINAAAVLEVPMATSVWDDGYGISVPKKYQTAKESISKVLSGFEKEEGATGMKIYTVKGWDYPELCKTYQSAITYCREQHIPVLIHVDELIQPQGHSTSGSHERYKSKEKLEWDKEWDCLNQFKKWILSYDNAGDKLATNEELDQLEKEADEEVKKAQKAAWKAYRESIDSELSEAVNLLTKVASVSASGSSISTLVQDLKSAFNPVRKDVLIAVRKCLRYTREENFTEKQELLSWIKTAEKNNHDRYNTHLYSQSENSVLKCEPVEPNYTQDSEMVDGRIVLRENFKYHFKNNPAVLTFGEDTGVIGGVNQSMEGMQKEFGELRVSDTGIREATIIGQGIGMAMRGLRPIAEIQYLDYLFYALQLMSDDLATVHYRTKGGQKAPLIIRTRGHRLEGIWHSGSPMGAIINAVRGMYVCVPRNMTTAAGFFNTLLASDDPALIIEPLNGYRTKEKRPANLGEFKIPLGVPEIVKPGSDITIVSYGSTFNICVEAEKQLGEVGIDAELIDVRTLLPFDIDHTIVKSLEKTNRLLIVDEDVPGGASAYLLDKILVEQKGYYYLDSYPVTLSAKEHRPAYSSDGDYFSKPSIEDVFETVYSIMSDDNPQQFPELY